jgi:hypothetical protein
LEEEFCIKIDIALELKKEFELALAKVVRDFARNVEFALAEEIVSKSKFTEQDAEELGERVKLDRLKELKSKGLI